MTDKGGRRQFAKQIAVAGTAVVLGTALVPAEPSSTSEADFRHQRILQKYGHRLSPGQRTRLRTILAYNEKMMEPIRNFPIDNGQPTACALKFGPASDARTK